MDRATRSMNWRTDRIHASKASSDQHTPRQENRYREKLRRQQSQNHRRDQLSIREPANSSRVYVGNLSYIAQKKDIENLVADAGLNMYVPILFVFYSIYRSQSMVCHKKADMGTEPTLTYPSIGSPTAIHRTASSISPHAKQRPMPCTNSPE